MSGHDRRPSVPAWTPLAAASSRSAAGSPESRSSSQDMQQDELDGESPSPQYLPQLGGKRKGVEHRTPKVSAHKKMRTCDLHGRDSGDIPASAHAVPVRRPASTQPTRTRSPLPRSFSTSDIAARRDFETRRSQWRHVARKSAAIPPPGRRKTRKLEDAGPSDRHMSPPAAKLPRVGGSRGPLPSPEYSKEQEQDTIQKTKPQISRRIHGDSKLRQKTVVHSTDVIEIIDSDEEPVPARVPYTSLHAASSSQQGETLLADVIVLSDSEEDVSAAPVSITSRQDAAKSNARSPKSTHMATQGFQTEPMLPSQVMLDGDVNIDEECGSHSDNEALETAQRAVRHSVSKQNSLEYDPFVDGTGQKGSKPLDTRAGRSPEDASTVATVRLTLPDSPHPAKVREMSVPASGIARSSRSPIAVVGRIQPLVTSSNPPISDPLREGYVHPHNADTPFTTASNLGSPASCLFPRRQDSGMVESLVPTVDDMAPASCGVPGTSNSPPKGGTDDQEMQTVEADYFEDWSSKDGSGTNTIVDRSASISDGPEEELPHQHTLQVIRPLTPKPAVASVDLKMMAASAKKRSNDKNLSSKKRLSRSSAQFNFTPIAVSPTSPMSPPGAAVASSFRVASPITPSLHRQQPPLHPPEVRGHLFGGDSGFFKAVHSRKTKSSNDAMQSDRANSPVIQTSVSATLATTSEQASPFVSPANIEEPPLLTPILSAPQTVLIDPSSSSSSPDAVERPPRGSSPEQEPLTPPTTISGSGSSAPLAEVIGKLATPLTTASEKRKKPLVPIPRPMTDCLKHRPLLNTIAAIRMERGKQQGNFIDLTLSDGEPEVTLLTSMEPAADLAPELADKYLSPTKREDSMAASHPEDVDMVKRSVSPDVPLAQVLRNMSVQSEPEAHLPDPATVSMQPSVSFADANHAIEPTDNVSDDEESVRSMLLPSSRSSPDPLDYFPSQHRRRIAHSPRRIITRSSSTSSTSILRPDSPALATPSDSGLPTGVSAALVRRFDQVSVTSIDDDDEGMTWQSYGKLVMREYARVYLRAKDLPHTVQDYMNSIPPFMRRAPGLERTIFKAVMRNNTAESEPQAPEIDIVNQVDDEACPPFEFYYSNQMWHSDSVPPPDASKLEGCDCFPHCVPDAKKCSCFNRQKQYYDANMSGFNYDKKGRLRYEEYPVFECNALCGCDDTCRNRVVQHGRKYAINIEKTPDKGWGVFAAERIPARTFIGIYSGEFLTDVEGEKRGRIYHLGSRTYLFDVDFWHLKIEEGDKWNTKYCVDAFHTGNFTRYLNHSCDPNCKLVPVYINEPDLEKPLLAIFTAKDVPAHRELCFSYFGLPDDDGEEASVDDMPQDDIFIPCKCGSHKCTGRMWK